ncbi:MAG: transporter substrate-binding domain-containing protein [Oceanospirillaceae bacterium]|nr:transporter substrate-binding domain-containing protein [Oceanospirillaceae bacterium]
MQCRIGKLLFGVILMVVAVYTSARDLHVNTGFTPPVSTIYSRVLAEAGHAIGVNIHVQPVSAERSLQLVAEGIDDAECCRVKPIIEREFPSLTPVQPSFYTARFVAFTRSPEVRITQWDDLKPYSVGTVTGWKIHVNNIRRIQPAESHILDSADAMFKMLDNQRIDVALLGDLNGLYELRRQGIAGFHLHAPALAEVPLHLLLNEGNADLAKPLGHALQGMLDSGRVAQIIQQVMGSQD